MNTFSIAASLTILLAICLPSQQPPKWTLRGRVVTAGDQVPLAGCCVNVTGHQATGYPLHWSWLEWRDPEPLVTGVDGRFELQLPVMPGRGISDGYPARIHLRLSAPGRVSVFGNFQLSKFFGEPEQDVGDFPLHVGHQNRFQVVDAAGQPQQGVLLSIVPQERLARSSDWWWHDAQIYQSSDSHGVVLGSPLPAGAVKVTFKQRATSQGVSDIEVQPEAANEPPPLHQLVVATLEPEQVIRGRVVDAAEQPVAGYLLYAVAKVRGQGKEEWLAARSDQDGSFTIASGGLDVEPTLQLRHPRNNRYDGWDDFGLHRWGEGDIEVAVAAPASLQLHVRAAGKPIEDLAVHVVPLQDGIPGADPIRTTANFTDGVVTLTGLRATSYAVRVHARGSTFWPSDWIPIEATEKPTPQVVDLEPTIARKLHVFTSEGRPLVGGTVELIEADEIDDALREQLGPGKERLHLRIVHYTMVDQRHSQSRPRIADRGVTDRSGAVTLRCRRSDQPVLLRVTGGLAQTCARELEQWHDGRAPILVTVPGAGSLTGSITPADFVQTLDASIEEERIAAAKNGSGHDPWQRSLGDLHATHRAMMALRQPGNQAPLAGGGATIAEDGAFAIQGVPPGDYEVVLVIRKRDGKLHDEVVEPPLGRITIRAGEVATVKYASPAAIQKQR